MPFDAAPVVRSPLPDNIAGQSALVLDMLEFYFDGGKRWGRGAWWVDGERRCLIEAVQFVRHEINRRDDRATDYLARAIRATGFTRDIELPLLTHIPKEHVAALTLVMAFNDARRRYSEIAAAVRTAKELAEADAWVEAACNAASEKRDVMAREPLTVASGVTKELVDRAAEIVSREGYGSNPLLREELDIGYHRASLCIEALQDAGILGRDYRDGKYELVRAIGFY